jgi:hypothetical protein
MMTTLGTAARRTAFTLAIEGQHTPPLAGQV